MSTEKRRVTLADIAKADGTHVTTVSLAIRNSPRLADNTRKRIQALAAKMGYVPDPAMQALVSYRKAIRKNVSPTVIAYLTNWTTRWGWKNTTGHPHFFEGAKAAAEEMGYKLEHFWIREKDLTYNRLNKILQARSIRGVIVASYIRFRAARARPGFYSVMKLTSPLPLPACLSSADSHLADSISVLWGWLLQFIRNRLG